ncbi:hypothetical protein CXQ85_004459 [Candidozyma haemuli]|uniref:Pentacotripeptide-repeat region of PRORP domain-containing protein n=1 Tax=Candidozyma haemuli TaxID=45357 RepID=A0A2V1AUH0_9ASCO|nr:hypothetical protein CXQ85_004459 [[Candida] haemuloni]PVH20943.1 hypothetical protein CXQ85_004459 [[Candida] haemuloni]
MVHKPDPSQYVAFLQTLYPYKQSLARLEAPESPRALVNHSALYRQYMELPSPGVGHMEPEDFECFMREILKRRDFVKPSFVASSGSGYYSPSSILRGYKEQMEQREAHVKMCWKVIGDLKEAGIPISVEEQNQLIYLGFFRDRKDVLDEVEAAQRKKSYLDTAIGESAGEKKGGDLSPKLFTWEAYKSLKESLPQPIPLSSINVLLLTAFRNENKQAVEDVKELLNLDKKHSGKIDPDRETFQRLIYGYADYGDTDTALEYSALLADQFPEFLDVENLNCIVYALVKAGAPESAEKVVQAVVSVLDRPLEAEEGYIKRLTPEDKKLYALAVEEAVQKGTHKIFPTEITFLPLLDYYSSSGTDFSTIRSLLQVMEHKCHLPLSTRVFLKVFESFQHGTHTLEDAKDTIAMVIGLHDAYHEISTDLRLKDKLDRLHMHPEVESLLHQTITPDSGSLPLEQGAFLKLSDRLVSAIYDAVISVIRKSEPESALKIGDHRAELFEALAVSKANASKASVDGPSTAELYQRDELNYIKKGYLIDLMDRIS